MELKYLKAALGEEVVAKVQASKILVVGAGGIGCELVKNLVLSGFSKIEIIDLDTIDVSNLNRQFLFRSEHVGKSKAQVAREVALKFNPRVEITAHHGNVKSPQFGLNYLRQFQLVLNALDNIDARKHVNRMCLATNTPLIESGTTGYLGQVSVIKKGETECYECTAKATQKVYPICTIRSTPEKPVHCIVWAKECYKLLFGKMEDSMLWEDPNSESETSSFMNLVQRPEKSEWARDKLIEYAEGVFSGLFELEIEKKIEMNLYKGARTEPVPIKLASIQGYSAATPDVGTTTWDDRKLWDVSECAKIFINTISEIYTSKEINVHIGELVFDKDDVLGMKFVTAASNLRAHIFGIPMQSLYDCKGIAGNIIPAIATTNAIIAGIQVLEAFKILKANKEEPISDNCKYTLCNRSWDSRGMLLIPLTLSKPHPNCYVCSKKSVSLAIDTVLTTLQELVDKVFKARIGMNEPCVSIGSSTIYEEGEDAEDSLRKNLSKRLCDLPAGGIRNETVIIVEDFSQDFTCNISVQHKDKSVFEEDENPVEFELNSDEALAAKDPSLISQTNDGVNEPRDDSDDDDIVVMSSEKYALQEKKRKLASVDNSKIDEGSLKKLKTATDDNVIIIND